MSKKERTGLSGKQKTALTALCLLTTWQLLQNDKITNALAALLFGGVIPGTDKVLPPETMMYIAGGVGVLVAVLVTVHFVRRSKRLHPQPLRYEVAQAESIAVAEADTETPAIEQFIETPEEMMVQEVITPESPTHAAPEKAQKVHRLITVAPFFASITKGLKVMFAFIVLHSGKLGVVLQKVSKQIAHAIHVLSIQALRAAKISIRYAIKTSTIARKNIVTASIATWHWAEPRLRQFDKWLERRVRDLQKWGRKKAHQHEDAQLFFDISRRGVKLLNQFAAKSIQKMSIVQKPRD